MGDAEEVGALRAAFLTRLATVMHAQGLTQTQLADRLGVTQAGVSKWFAVGSFPGEVILRMPDALNVNGHWLLTGQGPMAELPANDPGYAAGVSDLAGEIGRLATRLARAHPATRGAESLKEIADRTEARIQAQLRARAEGEKKPPRGGGRRAG